MYLYHWLRVRVDMERETSLWCKYWCRIVLYLYLYLYHIFESCICICIVIARGWTWSVKPDFDVNTEVHCKLLHTSLHLAESFERGWFEQEKHLAKYTLRSTPELQRKYQSISVHYQLSHSSLHTAESSERGWNEEEIHHDFFQKYETLM